jgi:molybdopterin molybdotransferase
MPEFLQLLPPTKALQIFLDNLPSFESFTEMIPVEDAVYRVTAADIHAPEALPAFSRSTVDGFALHAADSFGASESLPAYLKIIGEVPMGSSPAFPLNRGECSQIHTGGMLPDGADAVIMLEDTQIARPGEVEILKACGVGENIIQRGEDVQEKQLIIQAGVRLTAAHIGGLCALGIQQIQVAAPPRIAVISSGDEVVEPHQTPMPGQVRDINSYTLGSLIRRLGGVAVNCGIVADDREQLFAAVKKAMQNNDAVVITAGSSASVRDLTADVIQEMGAPGVLVHGVNVRPGKPTILAVCNQTPIIGLPGNPVSALVIAGLFIPPLVQRMLGMEGQKMRPYLQARLSINLSSQAGREDWIPVRLLEDGQEGWIAEPIFYKSNLIFTLANADGLLRIPSTANGLEANQMVQVHLLQ